MKLYLLLNGVRVFGFLQRGGGDFPKIKRISQALQSAVIVERGRPGPFEPQLL